MARITLALAAVSDVPPPFFVILEDFPALTDELLFLSSAVIDHVSSLSVILFLN